jgi:hypothetical protein
MPADGYLLFVGGLVLAAVFGYLRALTTRVWREDGPRDFPRRSIGPVS